MTFELFLFFIFVATALAKSAWSICKYLFRLTSHPGALKNFKTTKTPLGLLILCIFLTFPNVAYSDPNAEEVLQRNRAANQIQDLQVDVKMTSVRGSFNQTVQYEMWLKKPKQLKIVYGAPTTMEIISDGINITMRTADGKIKTMPAKSVNTLGTIPGISQPSAGSGTNAKIVSRSGDDYTIETSVPSGSAAKKTMRVIEYPSGKEISSCILDQNGNKISETKILQHIVSKDGIFYPAHTKTIIFSKDQGQNLEIETENSNCKINQGIEDAIFQ